MAENNKTSPVEISHLESQMGENQTSPSPSGSAVLPVEMTADPLTWKRWMKILITINICMNVFTCNVNAAGVSTTITPVAKEFGVSTTRASAILTYNVLAQGLSNLIWVPTMNKFGKRHTILIMETIFLPTIIWCACSKSFNSLLAGRIIAGFASGASEAFGPAVIGDVWYEHDYTVALGFFTACVFSGAGLGQPVLGYVTQGIGWRWSFWITFILAAINFIMMIIYLPETTYKRDLTIGVSGGDLERAQLTHMAKTENGSAPHHLPAIVPAEPLVMSRNLWYIKHPHLDYSRSWFKSAIAPFAFMASPTIIWACTTYGVSVGAFTTIGVCVPQLFSVAPYYFKEGAQGLIGLSAFVGILLGSTIGTWPVDWVNARMETRRRRLNLDHKPEDRLVMMWLPFITVGTGLLMYGDTVQKGLPWIAPSIGYVMHCFGIATMSSISLAYAVDAYIVRSGEVMVLVNCFRSLLTFGMADVAPNWLVAKGALYVYGVLAGINFAVLLLAIPIYYSGPWLRRMTDRFLF